MSKKIGLGKGFGSLLPEDFDNSIMLDKGERVQKILIKDIKPDPNQPRKTFDKASINELAESIKRYGILQPLVVTRKDDNFVIIAGERRYHAAKVANLSHLPVLVRTLEDLEKLEIGLIENMQRVDLSPIEQALSIAKLNDQFNIPIQDIAVRLGKANTTIVNIVRLLQLPDFAIKALENNQISEGHARTILSLTDKINQQKYLIDQIIKNKWSVRQAEFYVKSLKETGKRTKTGIIKDPKMAIYETKLGTKYSSKVKVNSKDNGGSVSFNFKTNKEFIQFLEKI